LECSALVTLTAELDLITRASEILSEQLPSGHPPLIDSDPLITSLQEEMSLPPDTLPDIANALGYLQHHLQELTK